MGSDEERLEEMLKAVMEEEKQKKPVEDMPELEEKEISIPDESMDDLSMDDFPDIPMDDLSDLSMDDFPDIPMDDFPDMMDDFDEMSSDDLQDTSRKEKAEELQGGAKERPVQTPEELPADGDAAKNTEKTPKLHEDNMTVNPLDFLSMSEEEIDKVLEEEASIGETVPEKKKVNESPVTPNVDDDLADIKQLLDMSDNHEQIEDIEMPGNFGFGSAGSDGEDVQGISEEAPAAKEKSEAESGGKPAKEKGRKKEKKEKKKEKAEKTEKKEKKEGIGKRLSDMFFGSDDDLEEEKEDNSQKKEPVKEKKKKEKKKKPEKKKEKDPQKAAKAKQQQAKKAEKAKLKAEKAEKAEKEKRAARKLPKKKVIVWVLFCASIGAGILLINSVGIGTIQLTDARNAFEEKDFGTAYKLLNGRELSEEDQLIFRQSSAVLHLQHAKEAYENHLELKKPVKAVDDLLRGVSKYQELLQAEGSALVTPELTAEYQNILDILQEQYSLSEAGALEINALESDYEYSLQLEALANGEIYQSQEEIEQQEEERAANLPELEDMLPEEEEYLNGSSD